MRSLKGQFFFVAVLAIALMGTLTSAQAMGIVTTPGSNGDGYIHYSNWGRWGSGYGGWVTDTAILSVYSAFYPGSPSGWERDYTYFELPIASLRNGTVTSATLQVYSTGFGLGDFWYGSTNIYHLNPGSYAPTGDVTVDNPHAWGTDGGWTLFNTDVPGSGNAGLRSFDVTSAILADLAVPGRDYATFWVQASREVYGGIYASESNGLGPRLEVEGTGFAQLQSTSTHAPLPAAVWLLAPGLAGIGLIRKRMVK